MFMSVCVFVGERVRVCARVCVCREREKRKMDIACVRACVRARVRACVSVIRHPDSGINNSKNPGSQHFYKIMCRKNKTIHIFNGLTSTISTLYTQTNISSLIYSYLTNKQIYQVLYTHT